MCKSELLSGMGSYSGGSVLWVGGKMQGQESVGRIGIFVWDTLLLYKMGLDIQMEHPP